MVSMDDLKKDLVEGGLCEKGFMTERYDEEEGDLVRTLTPKGKKFIVDKIKTDPHTKSLFIKEIKKVMRRMPDEYKALYIETVKEELQ